MSEAKDDVLLTIAMHYLLGGCDGCPFYDVAVACDSKPVNCKWMVLHSYFRDHRETNWERWFGTPSRAAESVSRLADRYDAMARGEDYRSPFTDSFRADGPCEFGLAHQGTLLAWLEGEVEE